MKNCIDCKIDKTLDKFHVIKNGYRSMCNVCYNKRYQPATGKPNMGRFVKGDKPKAPFVKGHIPWNLGMPVSDETKNKLSIKLKGRIITPENLKKFRDGGLEFRENLKKSCLTRYGQNYKKWKQTVYEKCNYTCTNCGSKNKLHAHHIIKWRDEPSLRFDVNNGTTYCASCHLKEEGFQKGTNYWKGKKISIDHKKKLSDSHKGKTPWNKKPSVVVRSSVGNINYN